MRILHTSDWHLGISTGPASRTDEQGAFLDWLLELLSAQAVDALVVAGDVFDSMHPSAEAQALYYRFLARVGSTGVRDVVVVGGNHDSPSRLDAPRALLEAVDVHVVGGVPPGEERWHRMLAPLRERGSDEVAAVCLAVPYVHEYRLGIRGTDQDREATRAAFTAAFSGLYTDLADRALAAHPGATLLATGHLTLGSESTREDYPHEIHQVGTIEGLPATILDPRIRYAALGHIHRAYPIAGSTARYCGTPIPYALNEMATPRRVLIVDLKEGAESTVSPVLVPRSRDLVQLAGPPDDVLTELAALTWSTHLPPLVHVRIQTSMAVPGLTRRLHDAVATHPEGRRPVLVEVQQRGLDAEFGRSTPLAPSLEELSPEQVFGLVCDARQLDGDDRQALLTAFRTIASADPETLQDMLDHIGLPPSEPGHAS